MSAPDPATNLGQSTNFRHGELLSLTGPDLPALALAALQAGLVPAGPPSTLLVDGAELSPDALPLAQAFRTRSWVDATWRDADGARSLELDRAGFVRLSRSAPARDARETLSRLAPLPFTLAVGHPCYPDWGSVGAALRYMGPFAGPGLGPYGWMMAFKGEGHLRLLSQRWLEQAPVTLHHGPEGCTMAQFHALDAGPIEALAQARPGHTWLAPAPEGGLLLPGVLPPGELNGLYDPEARSLSVVPIRPLDDAQLAGLCAARNLGSAGQPVQRLRAVYLDPALARQQHRALWLREIEVYAFIHGRETRLGAPPGESP